MLSWKIELVHSLKTQRETVFQAKLCPTVGFGCTLTASLDSALIDLRTERDDRLVFHTVDESCSHD
jgi:hypothetical protein